MTADGRRRRIPCVQNLIGARQCTMCHCGTARIDSIGWFDARRERAIVTVTPSSDSAPLTDERLSAQFTRRGGRVGLLVPRSMAPSGMTTGHAAGGGGCDDGKFARSGASRNGVRRGGAIRRRVGARRGRWWCRGTGCRWPNGSRGTAHGKHGEFSKYCETALFAGGRGQFADRGRRIAARRRCVFLRVRSGRYRTIVLLSENRENNATDWGWHHR